MNPELSLFHGSYDSTPARMVTLDAILTAIRQGAYRESIQRIRRIRSARGEEAYKTAKARLDAVTFGGTFAPTRAKSRLVQHSGICHGDLDHLADLAEARAWLCADPHTLYCFTSPSANGLKVGLRIPVVPDDDTYKRYWQAIADYYRERYGLTWDPSGKDISRLCYVSWDPDLYYRPDAHPWQTAIAPEPTPEPQPEKHRHDVSVRYSDRRQCYGQRALDTAIRMLDASTDGNRHHTRSKVAYLIGGYIAGGILSKPEAIAALEPVVRRNTRHFKPSWRTVKVCLEAGKAKAISFEELERERQEWLLAHGYGLQRRHGIRMRTVAPRPAFRTVAAREVAQWPK